MSSGATIVAIATPPGPAARGVVRGSGPASAALLHASWSDEQGNAFDAASDRGVYEGTFFDEKGAMPARLYWMPEPRSFTREDVFELHLPSSPYLLRAVQERLLRLGAKSAEPGEFTRRAFLSGRIDLSRAEGVLALVEARNSGERRAATMLLAGGLERRMEALRETLDTTRALCEASLDFDETDTGHVPEAELREGAGRARELLMEAQRWETRRVPESGLPRVVLAGLPNAGKSELFNRLCQGAEAIVAPIAGTTRDTLRGEWPLPGGSRCVLSDTAGEEELAGAGQPSDLSRLRQAAQGLSSAERGTADLVLWVVDAGAARGDAAPDRAIAGLAAETPVILCWNQVDRGESERVPPPDLSVVWREWGVLDVIATSGRTGEGLDVLADAVETALAGGSTGSQNLSRELTARHSEALRSSAERIAQALVALEEGLPLEVFAEELRLASEELDAISGSTVTERLLDRIFARFCLGK